MDFEFVVIDDNLIVSGVVMFFCLEGKEWCWSFFFLRNIQGIIKDLFCIYVQVNYKENDDEEYYDGNYYDFVGDYECVFVFIVESGQIC